MEPVTQYVSDPQKAILLSTASINLFLAGLGSGKSHLNGIISYQLIRMFPDATGFVGANFYDQLNTSTLFRIREYWRSIGVSEYDKDSNPYGQYVIGKRPPVHYNTRTHNFKSYDNIISFVNGAVIFVGSMDNAKSHEGKELSFAFLDETKDTEESDVKEIIVGRLRKKGIYMVDGHLSTTGTDKQQFNPLFITTSPGKTPWISEWFDLESHVSEISEKIYSKTDFFQKRIGDKFVTISSTWHNVRNVGENYINNILANNTEERGRALVYGSPFAVSGGEFYSSFNRLHHVGVFKYDPSIALHITFDQNSVPYNTAIVRQVKKLDDLWMDIAIKEICLENPRNSTEEVCDEIIRLFPKHDAGLFYYGDASGHNRTTMNKDFKHHYEIIAFKLRRYLNNSSDRTMISNPSLVKRRDFMNKIFEEKLPVRNCMDESCKNLIADYMYVKQDKDNTKVKKIIKDKETGDSYQKWGHCSDADDYHFVELFKNYYEI
jgi:hypothetical protein